MNAVEAPVGAREFGRLAGVGPDEEVDGMLGPAVNKSRDGPALQVVQPSAGEGEALRGEVLDGRGDSAAGDFSNKIRRR